MEKISGNEHVVRLSYVQKDEEGNICKLSEPLKVFQGQVERFQLKSVMPWFVTGFGEKKGRLCWGLF